MLPILLMISIGLTSRASIPSVMDENAAAEIALKLEQNQNLINENEKKQRQILSNLFEINQRIKKISKEKV